MYHIWELMMNTFGFSNAAAILYFGFPLLATFTLWYCYKLCCDYYKNRG